MKQVYKTLNSLIDSHNLSLELTELLAKKNILLLKGDIGSGKTTLTSMIINNLIRDTNVTSPTFNILKIYEKDTLKIFHYDLYRIKSLEEIEEIGFYENIENGINIIEWPEIIESVLDNYPKIIVDISINKNFSRSVAINA